jgi:hypothetical protein
VDRITDLVVVHKDPDKLVEFGGTTKSLFVAQKAFLASRSVYIKHLVVVVKQNENIGV